MEKAFEYKMTLYNHNVEDEYDVEGAVFANDFVDAVKKLEKAYVYDDPTGNHTVEICEMFVKEYYDSAGEPTDIYETKGFSDYKETRKANEDPWKTATPEH